MIKPFVFNIRNDDGTYECSEGGDNSGVYTEVEHVDDLVAELKKLQTWFEREATSAFGPTTDDMERRAAGIAALVAKYSR